MTYPGCQFSAVYGLSDNFAFAEQLTQKRLGTGDPLLWVSHLRYDETAQTATRIFSTRPVGETKSGEIAPGIIIVPPCLTGPPAGDWVKPLADWLARRHAAGSMLASVCGGTFLMAEAGILDGRPATTHWAHATTLAERFNRVKVDAARLIIDDGDVITAGGAMAWIDLGLKIIERQLGPTAMIETARFLLVDPSGREQRDYSTFYPKLDHGDSAILKVQHWLQSQGPRKISIGAMAECARMEERTFLRRFQQATGHRPTQYCQQLRVEKARQMLETSRLPIDQIAWDVGYENATAFRKIFIRVTGVSPIDYRKRFGAGLNGRRVQQSRIGPVVEVSVGTV